MSVIQTDHPDELMRQVEPDGWKRGSFPCENPLFVVLSLYSIKSQVIIKPAYAGLASPALRRGLR